MTTRLHLIGLTDAKGLWLSAATPSVIEFKNCNEPAGAR